MTKTVAKPFLKWAGGKTQLIEQIKLQLPSEIMEGNFTYIEPFVGSGAILFWLLEAYPNMKKAIINDVNTDLTDCYKVIKNEVEDLIKILEIWEKEYHDLADLAEEKKVYYYNKRELFNTRKSNKVQQSALLIFLNKTCFNGLYRVNKSNKFNVPKGSYKKPSICNAPNLYAVAKALQKVEIRNGDFENTLDKASQKTFFYFDPPYKPLNATSNFNAYAKRNFDDAEQIRLKDFCVKLNHLGHRWILSNSDVKNNDTTNEFFDELYAPFHIQRVRARRSINSKGKKRGNITELLVSNKP